MKKFLSCILILALSISLAACGSSSNKEENSQNTEKSKYTSPEEVLNKVLESYAEEQKFPVQGGDYDTSVMDKAGKYDISKSEEMDNVLGFPVKHTENIDAAASMIHMLNANTFTGACYHLKDGVKMDGFAEDMKANISDRQWLCGFPDTCLVIAVDNEYVITAFGKDDVIEHFKENTLKTLEGSKVLLQAGL